MSNKYFYINNLTEELKQVLVSGEKILALKPTYNASEAMRAMSSIISRNKLPVTLKYIEWIEEGNVRKGVSVKAKEEKGVIQ